MTYSLEFEEHALKEFKQLAPVLRDQFKKKLATVLENPCIPANRLSGLPDCYKIKLKVSVTVWSIASSTRRRGAGTFDR